MKRISIITIALIGYFLFSIGSTYSNSYYMDSIDSQVGTLFQIHTATAQTENGQKVITLKAKKGKKGGKVTKIKDKNAVINDAKNTESPPPSKSKIAKKGADDECKIEVVNLTPFYVDIFIDLKYEGTIRPWSDYHMYFINQNIDFLAETVDFVENPVFDFDFLSWEQKKVKCFGPDFTREIVLDDEE